MQENEEEKDPDDYAWKKPKEPNVMFDPTKPIDNAEDLLKQSKKGQVLMLFVQVAGDITKDEAEKITGRWQSSLFNGNIQIQRYMIEDTKAIFLLQDGSLAWDVKDFLINQPECRSVEIEQKTYWGKAAKQSEKDAEDKKLDDLRKKREKDPIVPKPVDEKQKDDKVNTSLLTPLASLQILVCKLINYRKMRRRRIQTTMPGRNPNNPTSCLPQPNPLTMWKTC